MEHPLHKIVKSTIKNNLILLNQLMSEEIKFFKMSGFSADVAIVKSIKLCNLMIRNST